MVRSFAVVIGALAGLAPVLAHAQVSIDQGKSPAEMFSNDCATCHKGARGLAKGRGSSELASFLVEHYTSSKDEAASLAAYVMASGGGESPPATQGRGVKPGSPSTRAAVEEPKPEGKPAHEPGKPDREAKKPEERSPTNARLQPPAEESKKPGDIPSIMQEPGTHQPAIVRDRHREPVAAPAQPAPAAAEAPASPEPEHAAAPPAPETGAVAGPANAASGEGEPVPRDNIPD